MNWYGWSQWSPATVSADNTKPVFWWLDAAFNWSQQSLTVTWNSNIVAGQTMRVELWKDITLYSDTYIAGATMASDATSYTFTKTALCALSTVASAADTSYYVNLLVSSIVPAVVVFCYCRHCEQPRHALKCLRCVGHASVVQQCLQQ
jgi:hypothetical protein